MMMLNSQTHGHKRLSRTNAPSLMLMQLSSCSRSFLVMLMQLSLGPPQDARQMYSLERMIVGVTCIAHMIAGVTCIADDGAGEIDSRALGLWWSLSGGWLSQLGCMG